MKKTTRFVSIAILLALLLGLFTFGGYAKAIDKSQQAEFVAPIMVVNASFLNVRTGPGIQYSILITVVGGTELPVLGVARDRTWYQVSTVAGIGWVNSQYTLPRGDFRNVPFVEAPPINQPGITQPDDGFETEAGDDASSTTSFSNGRQWGISVVVPHPFRSQATMNSTSLGTISAQLDFIYNILAANTGDGIVWYQIEDPALGIGWIEGPKSQFRPFACDLTAIVTNQQIRPTIGPDGSGTLDGNIVVEGGQEAYLIDAIDSFYKIELIDGNSGWVFSEDVSVRDDSVRSQFCEAGGTDSGLSGSSMTTSEAEGTTGAQSAVARVVINTGFLNLRSGPGAQYTVVTTLPGGTELPVIGRAPDGVWYLVSGSFGQAWLNVDFTLFRGDGSNLPIIRDLSAAQLAAPTATITNAVTLYAAPDTTLGVVGALSGPVDVDVVARTPDFGWVQLRTDLGFGWVLANQVEVRGDTTLIPVVGG